MWSKLISWILAAITAMFNGFGMYTHTPEAYTGNTGYTIQQESPDYADLRSWYIKSFGSGDTCVVERRGNTCDINKAGFAYIVKDEKHNPDAKLEFAEGAVIIAPSRCKVVSQPDSSGNKMTVLWDAQDYTAFKMEIINPAKWFCCESLEPPETGVFVHSVQDHRIQLEQGDTIAVCGPETTVELWRGDAHGALAKVSTLREFLLYDSSETGNPDASASGSQGATSTQPTQNIPEGVLNLPSDKMWTGSKKWHGQTGRWWMGSSPNSGGYPAEQYAEVDNKYYYFDSQGWLVTGWGDDERYYFDLNYLGSAGQAYEGVLARNTIVPKGEGNIFVYVNDDGKVVEEGNGPNLSVNIGGTTRTFVKESDGTYTEQLSN